MSNKQLILTPSALNKYIKNIIEQDFYLKSFDACGEISNLKYHSNGNIYFSIKDEQAQISCVMFKNYALKSNVELKEGMKIEISGSFYLYVKGGSYNINVTKINEFGIGDLFQKFNELKNSLQKEGLFAKEHKKPLHPFPQNIAIITSPTGAAVQDMITTLKKRYPIGKITVISALVQGQKAKDDIASKIELADSMDFDVIIVGRGGGSIEDLWAFNEKVVALSIYNCKTPIISCVGHETDTTISDFVADVRAATPTAAAMIATPDISALSQTIDSNVKNIANICNQKIALQSQRLEVIKQNQYFINPLMGKMLSFDQTAQMFNHVVKNKVNGLTNDQLRISNMIDLIVNATESNFQTKLLKLNNCHNQIDALNPLAVLSRGFSKVSVDDKTVMSVHDVKPQEKLQIIVKDGIINALVCDTTINKEYDAK